MAWLIALIVITLALATVAGAAYRRAADGRTWEDTQGGLTDPE